MLGDLSKRAFAIWTLGVLLLLAAVAAPAYAGQRVALVVGNATYDNAPSLATPLSDAADIGAALERLGFAVSRIDDADQGELRRGFHDFARAAGAAETALMYYAGHAIAAGGRNFLVPVDAQLSSSQDIEFEAIPLELAERAVGRASNVRLIILDASRHSPFAASMTADQGTEPVAPGLARIDPPAGTLVALAAKEGTVALEGEGRNSAFGETLLRHLEVPGLTVRQMLYMVRDALVAATGGTQEPAVYGSLLVENAYLGLPPTPSGEAQATGTPAPTPTPGAAADDQLTAEKLAAERLFWESVKDSGDPAEIQTYLDQYPSGTFAALARARLKRLGGTASPVSPDVGSVSDAGTPGETRADTPSGLAEQQTALEPKATEAELGLQRDHRRLIQSGLALLGFDPGPADGVFGQRTRAAIREWQASSGKAATGYLDEDAAKTLARRGIEAARESAEAPSTSEQREGSKRAAMDTLAEALRVAGEIGDLSDRAEVLANIGAILGKAGDSERAIRSFELASAAARQTEYGSSQVNALANIAELQAAVGDAAGAAQSIRAAMAVAKREDVGISRGYMLAEIAGAQASAGDIRAAFSTAQEIEDESPRGSALSKIVEAQASAGDFQIAFETAKRIEDEFYLSFGLASIAEAQVSAGDVQMALETARRITVESSLARALHSIAEAQALGGDVRMALQTAKRIDDELYSKRALFRIAEAQVSAGDEQGAFVTLQRIEDKSSQVNLQVSIAKAQAEANDAAGAKQSIERALAITQRIVDEDARSYALVDVAKAQAAVGDTGGAAQSIRRALASAKLVPNGPFARDAVLAAIAYAQARTGEVRAALGTAEGIIDERRRAGTLASIFAMQLGVELVVF